jgi:mitogen-activated protein kinase kinase kinase
MSQPRSYIGLRGQTSPFPNSSQSNALLEPPPGMAYLEFISSWTDSHVARWLSDIKCGNHASAFKANDIRGDVILELDQETLREIGLTSIGDRLRIINAVKTLRQRSSSRSSRVTTIRTPIMTPKVYVNGTSSSSTDQANTPSSPTEEGPLPEASPGARSNRRPPPLHLAPNTKHSDLPRLVRDTASAPDPARRPQAIHGTPSTPVPVTPPSTSQRNNVLPPLPPAPRTQLPLPPPPRATPRNLINNSTINGRRTPTQPEAPPFTSAPLPAPPSSASSSSLLSPATARDSAWYGLPSDPRPRSTRSSNGSSPAVSRSPSALQRLSGVHGRNTSLSAVEGHNSTSPAATKLPARPYTGTGSGSVHPFSQSSAQTFALSPINEAFNGASATSPSSFAFGRGPFAKPITSAGGPAPLLDDVRRKLVKFYLADEGHSCTINVADCAGGVEVLERALKKFGKGGQRSADSGDGFDHVLTDEGGLVVDGWALYLGYGDSLCLSLLFGKLLLTLTPVVADPITETELMALCFAAPDSPVRAESVTLKRYGKPKRNKTFAHIFGEAPPASPNRSSHSKGSEEVATLPISPLVPPDLRTSKSTKRASSISILSGLGVRDPEKALDPPLSPSSPSQSPHQRHSVQPPSPQRSSTGASPATKRPSKLRNFFGQRPPSELITNHLTEYFPFTEKKVLERTKRQSTMRTSVFGKRDSALSFRPPRFSTTERSSSPRPSFISRHSHEEDDTPSHVSLSTTEDEEDEEKGPVSASTDASAQSHSLLLPPVMLSSESFAESVEGGLTSPPSHPSRLSTASHRVSFLTELRSKRDRSDTASLMTVDQITAEVESRRESVAIDREMEDGAEEWPSGEEEAPGENPPETIIVDDDDGLDEETESSSSEDDRTSEDEYDEPEDSIPAQGLFVLVFDSVVSSLQQGTSGLRVPSSGLARLAKFI